MAKMTVKYTGPTQHTRILTKADQRNLGVEDPKKELVWDREHGHTLDIEDADDALVRFFEASNTFKVKTESPASEPDQPSEG
jgi:hypothetical protein